MPLETAADGSITLRPGSGAIYDHLTRRYGTQPTMAKDRVGGSVGLLCWRFQRDGIDYAAVASAGMERIPFIGESPTEVVTEVRADQVGAADVIIRTVVRLAVQEFQAPWTAGRIWMNDQPILSGTRIQALVAGPSGEGGDTDIIRDAAGVAQGTLQTVFALTVPEAEVVAREGLSNLFAAHAHRGALLADVTRREEAVISLHDNAAPDAVGDVQGPPVPPAPQEQLQTQAQAHDRVAAASQKLPASAPAAPLPGSTAWTPGRPVAPAGTGPRREDSDVSNIAILVSKLVWEVPVSWIECDEHGRLAAFTQTETQAQLDDINMLEVVGLASVLSLNPWLEEFTLTAAAGDFSCYDGALGGWVNGRL